MCFGSKKKSQRNQRYEDDESVASRPASPRKAYLGKRKSSKSLPQNDKFIVKPINNTGPYYGKRPKKHTKVGEDDRFMSEAEYTVMYPPHGVQQGGGHHHGNEAFAWDVCSDMDGDYGGHHGGSSWGGDSGGWGGGDGGGGGGGDGGGC